MSNLRADKVGPSAGGTLRDLVRGVAAAWANFNGITNVIRDSQNIASFIDNGTGAYQINYTAAMLNGNYPSGGSDDNISVGGHVQTAGYLLVYTRNTTIALADTGVLSAIVQGSLA